LKRPLLSLVFFCTFFLFQTLHAVLGDIARSLKIVHIRSLSQTIRNNNFVILEGQVEILIDKKLHMWADRVVIDKTKQTLQAESNIDSTIIIEDENFLVLADKFFLNIALKTGYADNLRLHVEEGYFSAHKAEKLNDADWQLQDMVYTACDAEHTHWKIKARKAVVHGSYFVKASGIVFNVGCLPVFGLPSFAFPIQGRSKSGFLIPHFAFDYEYGFGIKQEYYKYFSPHCDTTLGVDWRDRKGVVFFDEFRWARAPENFTQAYGQYAVLRRQYAERHDQIVKTTQHPYWINAKDYRLFSKAFDSADINTLTRIDFGTNKQIGYHFFNSTHDVDDTFANSGIARVYYPKNVINFTVETSKVSRKYFFEHFSNQWPDDVTNAAQTASKPLSVVKELEDRADVSPLPHVEWNTAFKHFGNLLLYRHDLFLDQMLYRQWQFEQIYVNSVLAHQEKPFPLSKADLIRFLYRGYLGQTVSVAHNTLSIAMQPTFQCTSMLKERYKASGNVIEHPFLNNGAYRFFLNYGAEWALPEGTTFTNDGLYSYTIQPRFTWNFLPKFYQDHWYYIDHWDRTYPQNQLACTIRNYWDINQTQFTFDLKQGYDFYKQADIFPLRRATKQRHLLPLGYNFSCINNNFYVGLNQEFEWGDFDLLQSEISLGLTVNKVLFNTGYLFQKHTLQDSRQLLSNIAHFVTLNIAIPLSNSITVGYDGQFYASQRSSIFFFDGIAPLIHRIRLDYNGHCWGMYIGYEEKKYKEYGIGRNERAIVFTFRLDSLGSFAKKFRRTPLLDTVTKKDQDSVER